MRVESKKLVIKKDLDLIRPRNESKDLLLSITKICVKLFKQTHTKPPETLEFKLTKPKEMFSFEPLVSN